MTSFHFESCLRKVNYRINHAEGQAETSLQVLHACMNIFHFWLTQYVTIAVCRGRKEKRNEAKKISTLLNWCTTHVSASWLGREIRGKCRKTCFLQHCSHFPFDSGYSGFWPVRTEGIILTGNLHNITAYQIMWTTNCKWLFQPHFHLGWCMWSKHHFVLDISISQLL